MVRHSCLAVAVLVVSYVAAYYAAVSRVRDAATMSPRYSVPFAPSAVRLFFAPAHAIDRRLRPAFWTP